MNAKQYYISGKASLKWLESPCVYNIVEDELYEIDGQAFNFLRECAVRKGCIVDNIEFLEYCLNEGLLAEEGPERVVPAKQSPIPSLRYLELQVTDKCNLTCRHCYIGKKRPEDLEITMLKKVLQEFEDIQGLRLLITGGEPLMYSNFNRLNSMLTDYEFRSILFTNGLLLTKKIIKTLRVHEIQVSIDGLEPGHDLVRGKGTHKKSMNAIHMAIDAGFEVSVSTMIHSGNLGDFEEMEELFKKTGIKDWTVDVPCLAGYLKNNTSLLPSPEVAGRYLKYGFGEGFHGGGEGYVCGHHLMSIMSDGKAAKCAFYTDEPVGHISEGLQACWLRIEHTRLDETECDCAYIDVCRGGCRYRAGLVSGSGLSKDPYRCSAFLGDARKERSDAS
jgi:radical SAM protein with 4Fe4S-binding SPASM domain